MLGINEWQIGVLNAANTASFLLVGLTAGALVDRMRKRRVMLIADFVRFLATISIPVLYFAGVIQIWHLFIAAAINGLATVFFDVSYQSYIPILVPKDKIASANSALETTSQISGLGGPAAVRQHEARRPPGEMGMEPRGRVHRGHGISRGTRDGQHDQRVAVAGLRIGAMPRADIPGRGHPASAGLPHVVGAHPRLRARHRRAASACAGARRRPGCGRAAGPRASWRRWCPCRS